MTNKANPSVFASVHDSMRGDTSLFGMFADGLGKEGATFFATGGTATALRARGLVVADAVELITIPGIEVAKLPRPVVAV